MKQRSIILLSIIACIGGAVFFFACKHIYEVKVAGLEQEAKQIFKMALDQDLEKTNLKDDISLNLKAGTKESTASDTVYWTDGKVTKIYLLDKEKQDLNIARESCMRALHTAAFIENPYLPDSLYSSWNRLLQQSNIKFKSAFCFSVIDPDGRVKLQKTIKGEWNDSSNLVFKVYIGYASEINVMGYLYYNWWDILYMEILTLLLIYTILGYVIFKAYIFLCRKIAAMHTKEIVEVIKEVEKEVEKEVIIEVEKEVVVEVIKEVEKEVIKEVIKEVERIDTDSVRSYTFGDNILFYPSMGLIEVNGDKHKMQTQSCTLLELFFLQRDNDFILDASLIKSKLWSDGSGDDKRMYKAITRLREILLKIDSSVEIIKKVDAYQLTFTNNHVQAKDC